MLASIGSLALQAALGIGLKLLTERFISRAIVIALKECSRRTTNTWDDELVVEMEKALGDAKQESKPLPKAG